MATLIIIMLAYTRIEGVQVGLSGSSMALWGLILEW